MKKYKSLLVMSGIAATAVLAFGSPAAAAPGHDRYDDDHRHGGSHSHHHGHDDGHYYDDGDDVYVSHDGDDRNGVLNGDILNICSLVNIISVADC